MALNRETAKRAEGHGWYYTSYGTDASDVLDYLNGDLDSLLADRYHDHDGVTFKVTVIVEEQ